jgi:hypothetical protein
MIFQITTVKIRGVERNPTSYSLRNSVQYAATSPVLGGSGKIVDYVIFTAKHCAQAKTKVHTGYTSNCGNNFYSKTN